MHIPQTTTAALELELFQPALNTALQPTSDYDIARWLYVPNRYSEYRYILEFACPQAKEGKGER